MLCILRGLNNLSFGKENTDAMAFQDCEKTRHAGKQHFFLFPQCFYTLSQTNFFISATFKFSSANALNFEKS